MIALITTTINIPTVLSLYRRHGFGVPMFVAGDKKTRVQAAEYCSSLPGVVRYLSPDSQRQWKCSELLGWNTITRRNIALLEAIRSGADVIVTCDDDNIPLDRLYFADFDSLFAEDFSGLKVGGNGTWFDPGQWQFPHDGKPVVQRGFPQDVSSRAKIGYATGVKIGLAQGVILGDPDTSAVDRMSQHPLVHTVSELFHAGFVVGNDTWTVCNTQNTAVLSKFAPALLCCPQFGRYDDIFASLICQRIMREEGYHVHFGKPFVWQQRNQHDLVQDLKAEMFGMEHIVELAEALDAIILPKNERMRAVYHLLSRLKWWPQGATELADAFMDDVETALQEKAA
jgi:hypothetical protein